MESGSIAKSTLAWGKWEKNNLNCLEGSKNLEKSGLRKEDFTKEEKRHKSSEQN